jgi:lipopolysaccharide/colanic/teichoic acid biosynthesis glycosyltransferase
MKESLALKIKRIFDIFASGLALIFLLPVFAIIGILIKIDSKGPVFFIQQRAGKYGKPFNAIKLRTMEHDTKVVDIALEKDNPNITRIGRYLRWGIDELPQLINVFKGDMSIVGPRPTIVEQTIKYNNWEKRRLNVKPGITGWALVNGRNNLSWEEKIEYDIWYIDNWSLWLDFKIILLTVWVVVVTKEGIYSNEN